VLVNFVKNAIRRYIVNMKVYIYVNEDAIVYLLGMKDALLDDISDINIMYSTRPTSESDVMISLTTSEFTYLKESGVLKRLELLIN